MPRATIEYMNGRAALKPASGGTNYAAPSTERDRRRAVDDRARMADLDDLERCRELVAATYGDFRQWFANLPPIGVDLSETVIPF